MRWTEREVFFVAMMTTLVLCTTMRCASECAIDFVKETKCEGKP